MDRRRALMAQQGAGPVYVDFTPVEYLESPLTSINHCGCILGQTNSQLLYVEATVTQLASGDNIFFATRGSSDTIPTYPYFGSTNRGYNTDQSPVIGSKTTIRATRTGTQSPNAKVRVGGWQDATYTRRTQFYDFKIFNSSNVLIAHYIPGYKTSTNRTGFYDTESDTFYPEITESGWGFLRSST